MQKEQHRFHGAEYVEEDHTDKEQEKYAAEQAAANDLYTSLEQIAADITIKALTFDDRRQMWEKLQRTIKSGAYLQKDGKK